MKPMTPLEIKQAIERAGYSQASLARDLDVTPQLVSQVVKGIGVSHRVRCHVSKAIGIPVDKIWEIKQEPVKTGRPTTRGLCDHQDTAA
ncbi:MAG: helix-turn-helix domain-containing protein [Desulfotignum sp.]|nr:helix-turn-helix domain-containing protein [Desulfotignum sp.]